MADSITINGTTVTKGEHKEITFNIARLPTHTTIDLPVLIYRAPTDGPSILVSAALHGDETNGIETIRRMISDNTIIPSRGTVIAMPIVNIFSFIHNSRKFPDGKDMNRSFPGSNSGSLAKRIAYILEQEILPNVEYVIDFHTGGQSKMNFAHIRCDFSHKKALEIATAFSPPYIVNSKAPDHSFRKSSAAKGIIHLTFEGGESLRFDEFSIAEGIAGIKRTMKHLKMTKDAPPANKPILLKSSWWNRAKVSGLFRSTVMVGKKITNKQILGSISDPFGENTYEIKARSSGYIIGLNNMCVVNKGDALVHIGNEH